MSETREHCFHPSGMGTTRGSGGGVEHGNCCYCGRPFAREWSQRAQSVPGHGSHATESRTVYGPILNVSGQPESECPSRTPDEQPSGFTQKEIVDLVDILGVVDWDNIEELRDSLTSVVAKLRALHPPSSAVSRSPDE